MRTRILIDQGDYTKEAFLIKHANQAAIYIQAHYIPVSLIELEYFVERVGKGVGLPTIIQSYRSGLLVCVDKNIKLVPFYLLLASTGNDLNKVQKMISTLTPYKEKYENKLSN